MRTAINIIGYNRIHYFSQVVESLSVNLHLPTFVYLDNCGNNAVIQQHVDCVNKFLPHAQITIRPRRYGLSANIFDANSKTFERGFDQMFLFEDDTVVAPNYIRLCMNLAEWAKKQSYKIGMVQGYSYHPLPVYGVFPPVNKQPAGGLNPGDVVFTNVWTWGYLLFRQTWVDCQPILQTYRKMVKGVNFEPEEAREIVRYLKSFNFKPMYRETIDSWIRNEVTNNPCQAGPLVIALSQNGYYRIAAAMNRAKYIGRAGINGTPADYDVMGFDQLPVYDDESDRTRTDFRFMPESIEDLA